MHREVAKGALLPAHRCAQHQTVAIGRDVRWRVATTTRADSTRKMRLPLNC
jgi:hypothetical protein